LEPCHIQGKIRKVIAKKPEGVIISELVSEIQKYAPETSKKTIREAIRSLVDNGFLMYLSRLGQTMISNNINRPVKISERIWIAPPNKCTIDDISNENIIIKISPGIAFGNGVHPTTKMCLQAIDTIFASDAKKIKSVLDIGTGTGVLAIATILLGAETCTGTDIDSCARAEAKLNIITNNISEDKIDISDTDIKMIETKFDFVIANLRYPTLISLSSIIAASTKVAGFVVLSGIRPEEKKLVLDHFMAKFSLLYDLNESGWCALLLERTS